VSGARDENDAPPVFCLDHPPCHDGVARALRESHGLQHLLGEVTAVRGSHLLSHFGRLAFGKWLVQPQATYGGFVERAEAPAHDSARVGEWKVRREDGQPRLHGDGQHRLVPRVGRPPARFPIHGSAEPRSAGARLGEVRVDRRLPIHVDHLQEDGRLPSSRKHFAEGARLQRVMIGVVVFFAEHDEVRLRDGTKKVTRQDKLASLRIPYLSDERMPTVQRGPPCRRGIRGAMSRNACRRCACNGTKGADEEPDRRRPKKPR